MSSIISDLQVAFQRECVLIRRQSSHLINGFCFFCLVGLVYQIMLGPSLVMPAGIALIVLWVLAFLSILLIADGWVMADIDNGFYEFWLSQDRSLWLLFLVKLLVQWLVIASLFAVFLPILCFQLGLLSVDIPFVILSLVISSLAMVCFCGFGAAITAGQASSGLLMAVLVMPLNIPPMIFGVGAVMEQMQSLNSVPILLLLTAFSFATLLLLPPFMGFCVRIIVE